MSQSLLKVTSKNYYKCDTTSTFTTDEKKTLLILFFSTILLGTRKMVRIGSIGLALSDPHFCILSRDCFNLSREYFSLWAIKTSLDRNASRSVISVFTRCEIFD